MTSNDEIIRGECIFCGKEVSLDVEQCPFCGKSFVKKAPLVNIIKTLLIIAFTTFLILVPIFLHIIYGFVLRDSETETILEQVNANIEGLGLILTSIISLIFSICVCSHIYLCCKFNDLQMTIFKTYKEIHKLKADKNQ